MEQTYALQVPIPFTGDADHHRQQGSTARTHQLATDAATCVYTRWEEWHQLHEQCPVDEPREFSQMARQFTYVWTHLTPVIREGELIIGARARLDPGLSGATDEVWGWRPDGGEYTAQFAALFAPPDRPDLIAMAKRGLISPTNPQMHRVTDYAQFIRIGSRALARQARELVISREGTSQAFTLAVAECHEALIMHAQHYADAVARLAASQTDPVRAAELSEIARICAKVPAEPADTFREALQSFWFAFMVAGLDIGRIDQYLYDFYARDLATGAITREQALECIECLLIKLHVDYGESDHNVSSVHTMTLGGLTPDGNDGTNELTRLFLQAACNVRLQRLSIYLRCHPGTPEDVIAQGVEMLAAGYAEPSFFGDEPIIAGLQRLGVPTDVARDYALGGCAEVVSPGRGNWGAPNGWINLTLLVDYALRAAAKVSVGDMEEVWRFINLHVNEVADACRDAVAWLDDGAIPQLNTSLFMPCCLAKGLDTTQGGAESYFAQWGAIGLPNAADMLYTAQQCAFYAHRPLAEVIALVDADDPGTRQQIRQLSKFGNGQPEVDTLASRLVTIVATALEQRSTSLRQALSLGHLSGGENMHIDYGRYLGATLDGRRSGSPLADSLAGSQGNAKCGPTAILHSLCTLDHSRLQAGSVATLMLNPADFRGREGCNKIVALIRTYVALGGSQLQLNVLDATTLRAAQTDPDSYRGLMVRVAGYSADFTKTGQTLQDEIIARFEGLN